MGERGELNMKKASTFRYIFCGTLSWFLIASIWEIVGSGLLYSWDEPVESAADGISMIIFISAIIALVFQFIPFIKKDVEIIKLLLIPLIVHIIFVAVGLLINISGVFILPHDRVEELGPAYGLLVLMSLGTAYVSLFVGLVLLVLWKMIMRKVAQRKMLSLENEKDKEISSIESDQEMPR